MFQMQKNNDDLQQAMTSLQDENEILREYLADVDLDNKTFQQKFSASSMKNHSQNHHSMFRNTSHVKVSDFNQKQRNQRKTIAMQTPQTRPMQLKTRKTLGHGGKLT